MTQPYREPAEMPAVGPVMKRVRVYRDIPVWLHVVTVAACIIGVGGLIDLHGATSRFHGLIVSAIIVLGMFGIAAFVTTGSLTFGTWEWKPAPPEGDE